MPSFMDAALGYVSLGWRVFPLKPRSKEPATAHGFKDATNDAEQVRRWWTSNPDYNIGIATGSGLCVIDVDDKPDKHPVLGSDMLRDWETEHSNLEETVCCKTGTGGMHYYYDVGSKHISGCQSDTIFIDLRCDGNYVVAPPSVHPDTGLRYEWDISPEDMPVTTAGKTEKECIQWVYDNRRGANGDGTKDKPKIPDEKISEGEGRNNFLYEQGCSARGRGSDDLTVAAFLESLNKMKCSPPVSDSELQKIVKSVCSKPIGMSDEAKAVVESKRQKTAQHVTVSNAIMDNYSACFLDGTPAIFDGITYHMGWESIERAILREWPNAKERDRKEVVKYLALTMPRVEASNPRYIGFTNGVLDVETMDLLSFSPDLRIPNVIPHAWNPDARSALLDKTLAKIACNDPYIESNLCEFIGLSMYRSGKYAFAAILLGKQGESASNGKSTYIDLIRNVLGTDNYSSLSLHALGERFMQDYLAGRLANLGDDISSEFVKGAALEVFKKSVAGSEITTDIKGRKGYSFKPYCTMVFSANKLPKLENLDDGVIRRLFPIRFNAHFTDADPDFDPDIGEKLKAEDVIEAAIVRGVNGLKRVIENRRPTDNEESRKMVRDIKTDNSTIFQWLDDAGIGRIDLLDTAIGYAYGLYEEWCNESGVTKKYAKWQFSKEICDYFKFKVKNTSREGRSVRIFADA